MANIKKIKLSNGAIYSIFDNGALRVDETTKKLITGNTVVDKVILDGHLNIIEIDDVPLTDNISNVLVQDTSTGEIKKRTVNKLLEDIGGISASVDTSSSVLTLKLGK